MRLLRSRNYFFYYNIQNHGRLTLFFMVHYNAYSFFNTSKQWYILYRVSLCTYVHRIHTYITVVIAHGNSQINSLLWMNIFTIFKFEQKTMTIQICKIYFIVYWTTEIIISLSSISLIIYKKKLFDDRAIHANFN